MGHNGDYPIDKCAIKGWKDAQQTARELEQGIVDRLDYVLKVWFKAFGCELNNWYFEGSEECSMGSLHLSGDSVYGIFIDDSLCNQKILDDMIIIDKDGNEYGWADEVPLRWLFDNDFEQEIVAGKKKYEDKELARKEGLKIKRAKQKAEDLNLADIAIAKLSKKELAALKKVL